MTNQTEVATVEQEDMDAQVSKPITSAASAENLAKLKVNSPESKEGNLMRNQGSNIDLAALYNQSMQGYGYQQPQQLIPQPQQPQFSSSAPQLFQMQQSQQFQPPQNFANQMLIQQIQPMAPQFQQPQQHQQFQPIATQQSDMQPQQFHPIATQQSDMQPQQFQPMTGPQPVRAAPQPPPIIQLSQPAPVTTNPFQQPQPNSLTLPGQEPASFNPFKQPDSPDGVATTTTTMSNQYSAAPSLGISFPRSISNVSMTEPGPVLEDGSNAGSAAGSATGSFVGSSVGIQILQQNVDKVEKVIDGITGKASPSGETSGLQMEPISVSDTQSNGDNKEIDDNQNGE